ncbi:MAG: hypothetical protein LRY71_04605 [Bacillaceae bacterium]|nr:hypothetical protein [Bacillaceae bacterium]
MKISISDCAATEIRSRMKRDDVAFTLVYDTEGCGCAVNGVPILVVTTMNESKLSHVDSNIFTFYINEKHKIFFEELMEIDCQNHQLILKSTQQIYTQHLPIKR